MVCHYFLDSTRTNYFIYSFKTFLATGEIYVYLAKTVQLFWIIAHFFSPIAIKVSFYYKRNLWAWRYFYTAVPKNEWWKYNKAIELDSEKSELA